MQYEHPQTISSEGYQGLQLAIFGAEIATLLPEHAAMFSAENNACFAHFIDSLPETLRDDCALAENGDKHAILVISDVYHDYRNLFESELAQNNPDAYSEFIDAVARGDVEVASAIVDDFHQKKELANSPVIDDELDSQFA